MQFLHNLFPSRSYLKTLYILLNLADVLQVSCFSATIELTTYNVA